MMINDDIRLQIWEKAGKINGLDPKRFRKDACGAIISWSQFGQSNTPFGWGIDHIYPKSRGGSDDLINLRPMHLLNVKAKGSSYPVYEGAVTMEGLRNRPYNGPYQVSQELQDQLNSLFHTSVSPHD